MPPDPSPFWLCHQCGAEMRPITVAGVAHCASCNSEFIEILDDEINPDPDYELPHPPTRPGMDPPPLPQHRPGGGSGPIPIDGLLGGLMGAIFGGSGSGPGPGTAMGQQTGHADGSEGAGGAGDGSGRTYRFTLGGGSGSVTFGTFGGGAAPAPANPWVGGYNGAPGSESDGLDAFIGGFGAPPRQPGQGQPGEGLEGVDLLQAIMQIVMEEGAGTGIFPGRGQMGDYVMTEQGFNDVLERLMHATGPQGPLPASETVIAGLPRMTFTEETLEKSQYKDCPVCKDDFGVGDVVVLVPCEHIFHPDCIVPWLQVNGSCPVCRFSLVPAEGNADAGARAEASAAPAAAAPGGAAAGVTGMLTGMLNRLWGQGGAVDGTNTAASTAQGSSASSDAASGRSSPAPASPSRPAPARAPSGPRPLPQPPAARDAARLAASAARLPSTLNFRPVAPPSPAASPSTRTPIVASPPSSSPVAQTSGSNVARVAEDLQHANLDENDPIGDPDVPVLSASPEVPASGMSSAIPADYRARHMRREQEQYERERAARRAQGIGSDEESLDDLD